MARITGISVRALHHYDEIGLLVPAARSRAGYRLYEDDDLLRLQQVLIGRELGLSLEDIRQALDDPAFDRRAALQRQLEQLTKRSLQTAEMISAVEHAITLIEREKATDDMDMLELFDGFDPSKYEAEARERWGETLAYKESARRTSRYTADDWKRFGAEQAALYSDIASAIHAGLDPASSEGMALAERHRVDRWLVLSVQLPAACWPGGHVRKRPPFRRQHGQIWCGTHRVPGPGDPRQRCQGGARRLDVCAVTIAS